MLVYASRLIGTPVLSVQASGKIAEILDIVVNPDDLKTIAFYLGGPLVAKSDANLLDVKSIREYSNLGIVIDDIDELIKKSDVVKIENVLNLNFSLIGLKAETKSGTKLGKVIDYVLTGDDFTVIKLVVKRPVLKGFIDPELLIDRNEIVEVTDYKIIIKDAERKVEQKSKKEEFVPNFVNPFRKSEQDFAPAKSDLKNPEN